MFVTLSQETDKPTSQWIWEAARTLTARPHAFMNLITSFTARQIKTICSSLIARAIYAAILLTLTPLAYAQSFVTSSAMTHARSLHTSTRLLDGRVVLAGGMNNSGVLDTVEIYNPVSNSWALAANLPEKRAYSEAVTLGNGRVLVVGGVGTRGDLLGSCLLYNPSNNTWSYTGSLNQGRFVHQVVLMKDGKVLAVGGYDYSQILKSAEIYDPTTGLWSAAAPMRDARRNHAATILADGRVLVSGGQGLTSSVEIYNPTMQTWTAVASMNTARSNHSSVLLYDGKVLIAGGMQNDVQTSLTDSELYDPKTNIWKIVGRLSSGRQEHAAFILTNGNVVVAGGDNVDWFSTSSCEIYNVASQLWESFPNLNVARASHDAVLLLDGRILIGAGQRNNGAALGWSYHDTVDILSVPPPVTPIFTINPEVGTVVNPNSSITFTANYVAGVAPFTYRWRKNGTIIGGANASSYTIASVKQSDEASYDCVITNNFGSFTTSATVLTVNDPVVIVTPPLAQAANAGQQVTLTVNVTGTEPISFQWRKNGVSLSDQNAPQLVLEVDANSTGFYDVLVTNPVSSVSTLPALLTALVPPVITSQPSSQDVSVGSTAFFTVTAEGPNLTYQWRRNGTNITGQTNAMLMLSNVQKANEGVYDVLVKNSFGAVLSDPVWLTLPQPLSLTEQPQDVTAAPGDTASFSVTASGSGLLTYQWNKDGKPIKDAKSSTLSVTVNDAVTTAGAYTVTVSSGSLKATSIPAYLRVSEAGLLIYKFTVTGNYFAGTRSSLIAQSGLLILDRLNQRGGIIRYGKNGKLDTFSTEIKDGLRTHSTGPMTNSQTVVSQVLQAGGEPNEEVAVLWLRGTDGAVTFSANDKTMAPKTLAGFQTELILTEGTEVESLSVNATLDNATSLQARQAGETVEQTLNRLSAGLQQKGFIRE
jgi:hypothetical protein